jgi:hypothetical protein
MKAIRQQTVIAEICGWKEIEIRRGRDPDEDKLIGWHPPIKNFRKDGTDYVFQSKSVVPDYVNNLDDMHDAEKHIAKDLRLKFASTLAGVLGCAWYQSNILLFATAQQHAEAFLKALGKWEESNE